MIIPISTGAERIFGGTSRNSVSSIAVQARSSADLTGAYQESDHLLLELHGITNPTDADFTITSEQSLISANTSVDHTLTILLGGIAAISLIVGGIGVMNIMLVSVTERIREIGLRKALGATPRVIRRQFLVEASVLGLLGGILGVVAGLLGVLYLPGLIGDPISTSPTAAVGALAIAWPSVSSSGCTPPAGLPRLPPSTPCAASDGGPAFAGDTKDQTYNQEANQKRERGTTEMQTLTSQSTNRRRWARFLGAGTTALVAVAAVAAAATSAGAATAPNPPARRDGERRRTQRLEHGGAERQLRPDHGELDAHDNVLQDRV